VHARVDRPWGTTPKAEAIEVETKVHAGRSIGLSTNRLGLIAKIDLIQEEDGTVVPLDYKHGKRPHVARGAYALERGQLCERD